MIFRKLALTLGILFTVVSLSLAQRGQGGPSPEKRAAKLSEKMKTELTLDDAQFASVSEINTKYALEKKSIHEANKGGDRSAMKTAMDELKTKKDEELQAVLTNEQFTQYQAMMEEMKEKRKEKRRN